MDAEERLLEPEERKGKDIDRVYNVRVIGEESLPPSMR